MLDYRAYDSLGRYDNDWLSARYHFSFAGYRDPRRSGLGPLLVWNDDRIRPGAGFERHGHRDMEIITYVRRGAIAHEDHLGNRGRAEAGDVQVMSAGLGILHAERNCGEEEAAIFQIWIEPEVNGLKPRWSRRRVALRDTPGKLVALASGRGGDNGALPIHQDAALLGVMLPAGEALLYPLERDRRAYLVPLSGAVTVNKKPMTAGDGLAVTDERALTIEAEEESEVLIADLP